MPFDLMQNLAMPWASWNANIDFFNWVCAYGRFEVEIYFTVIFKPLQDLLSSSNCRGQYSKTVIYFNFLRRQK